jgi:hypothetical protein
MRSDRQPVSSVGVTHVVGGGNTSAMNPAVFQNLQMRHQQMMMMMRSRMSMPPVPQVKEIVQEIAAATKSEELLREFHEGLKGLREELKGLREDFNEDRAEQALREGPYSGVYKYAPANKADWLGYLNFLIQLVGIILAIILNRPQPPTIIIQSHDQEIVQQLNEINEHQEQEIEQLKEMNEHLAEEDAKDDAKPSKPKNG